MRRLGFATLLLFLVGCGTPPPLAGPARVNVTGRCLAAGNKPSAGAVLVFHRTGVTAGELPPRAKVNADGSFTAHSADGDGLPEGEYRVTVEWRTPGENGEDGKSLVADRYTRPASTPLKASVKADPDGGCTLTAFTLTN
jgi:hypothetical protein